MFVAIQLRLPVSSRSVGSFRQSWVGGGFLEHQSPAMVIQKTNNMKSENQNKLPSPNGNSEKKNNVGLYQLNSPPTITQIVG